MKTTMSFKAKITFVIFLLTSPESFCDELSDPFLHVQSIENRLMDTKGLYGRVRPYSVSVDASDSLKEVFVGQAIGHKIDFESPKGSDGYLRIVGTIRRENDSMSIIKLYVEFGSSQFRFNGKYKNGSYIVPNSAKNAGKIFYPKGVIVLVRASEHDTISTPNKN